MAEVSFQKTPDAAKEGAVIEIAATVTPVEGVVVESVNSHTPAAPAPTEAPVAPVAAAAPAGPTGATGTPGVAGTPAPALPIDTTPVAAIPTAAAPAPVTALATVPTGGAVTKAHDPTAIDNDDNIGFDDVILPRINIVQKVGDLSAIFPGGNIVLNQQVEIHEPLFIHPEDPKLNKPGTGLLTLTVIGFRKRQFTEKVAGGKLGMLLNTEEDVVKNGGTLDYNEWKASVEAAKIAGNPPAKRRFERLATALILIEKPEFLTDADHVLFPYDFEGKYYTLCLWSMKGISYTSGAKLMFTARKIGHLRAGYSAQSWSVTTKLETYGDNMAYKPILKPGAKNSDSFRKFCRTIIGQE